MGRRPPIWSIQPNRSERQVADVAAEPVILLNALSPIGGGAVTPVVWFPRRWMSASLPTLARCRFRIRSTLREGRARIYSLDEYVARMFMKTRLQEECQITEH